MVRKLRLNDDPREWLECFGLEDNPFSPVIERKGVDLKPLDVGNKALSPHCSGLDALHDLFFVENVDNVCNSLRSFEEYMEKLARDLKRRPPILLIYGPQGAGKSTFANICRYVLAMILSKVFHCDVDLNDPRRSKLMLADIVGDLTRQVADQLGGHAAADPLNVIADNAQQVQDTLALMHLKHLSKKLIRDNGYERKAVFLFLSSLRLTLIEHVNPLLIVTTSEDEIKRAFGRHSLGAATEGKLYELGELTGEDVVKVVSRRLATFHHPDWQPPEDLPLFPFTEDAILASFEVSQDKENGNELKENKKGSLPFRNVNTILSGALRMKLGNILGGDDMESYRPDLHRDELERRVIHQSFLESAVRSL